MTNILRLLKLKASHLPFETSFEVTHHGPYLETPAMYVEIGSDETMWGHRGAAEAIASAIMEAGEEQGPVAIGIGGGHYAPRFTDVVSTSRIAFGHMMPTYAIKEMDEERLRCMVVRALESSGHAQMAYLHKKSIKRSEATAIRRILEGIGVRVVDSATSNPYELWGSRAHQAPAPFPRHRDRQAGHLLSGGDCSRSPCSSSVTSPASIGDCCRSRQPRSSGVLPARPRTTSKKEATRSGITATHRPVTRRGCP